MIPVLVLVGGVAILAAGCKDADTPAPEPAAGQPRAEVPRARGSDPPSEGGARGPESQVGDPADWCRGHGLPESKCTKCNPELIEKFVRSGDWCGAHGFPESACPQCNPMKAPAGAGHGATAVGDPDDWCRGHGLPESKCTKCNPELVDKFKKAGDWCAGHGFPESACPQCNPMKAPGAHGHGAAVGDPNDWCGGHGLPESKCTKCNPELVDKFKKAGDWCAGHGFPESACPQCNPMKAPGAGQGKGEGGGTAIADPNDWCGGHGLPESKCTQCNPELVPTFKASGDWCAEHGYPESACPTCNPQARPAGAPAVSADWCVEHGLPESQCTKCNRALVDQYRDRGDWCAEHGFPESVCPICNPQAPPAGVEQAAIEARVVRLTRPELEDAAGIRTVPAQKTSATASVACTARVTFDADRVADVRALVPGIVRSVRAELGSVVEAGAPLFELQSSQVGQVQATLQSARQRARTARANLTRQRELRREQIASARAVEVAEQELAAARGEVSAAEAALGMTGARQAASSGRYTVVAPIAGTVVRRPAVVGVLATAETSLATVADTSVMWALCDVPEAEASRVALGQRVRVTVDGVPDGPLEGRVEWISAEVDPRTRTVTARAAIPNPRGSLRAHQFGRAEIDTGAPRQAVAVPRDAVQRVLERDVVFVRSARGVYEPRVVRRRGVGDPVQVEGRVAAGDAVVTAGAILLRTEATPGSIGAGCCEVE